MVILSYLYCTIALSIEIEYLCNWISQYRFALMIYTYQEHEFWYSFFKYKFIYQKLEQFCIFPFRELVILNAMYQPPTNVPILSLKQTVNNCFLNAQNYSG